MLNHYLGNKLLSKLNRLKKQEKTAISSKVKRISKSYLKHKNSPDFRCFEFPDDDVNKQVYRRLVKLGIPVRLVAK